MKAFAFLTGDEAEVWAEELAELLKGKPAWMAMRDAEIMKGHQWVPVGSVKWLPARDWHKNDCVSITKDGEVRLVAIAAKRPRSGALRRLLAGIEAAGFRPVIVCPIGRQMPAILAKWGWVLTKVGATFYTREDQWRPPEAAQEAADASGGTDTPADAPAPAGEAPAAEERASE